MHRPCYAERIKELARSRHTLSSAAGTYTPDQLLEPPQGKDAALAKKFLMARGFGDDAIRIKDWGSGAGKILGSGIFAGGHVCTLEASEAKTKRLGQPDDLVSKDKGLQSLLEPRAIKAPRRDGLPALFARSDGAIE